MLQETTSEMARNGCTKVVIVNGHGGNTNLLSFFAQAQLETPKDWVLYVITGQAQEAAPIHPATLEARRGRPRRRARALERHGVPSGSRASGALGTGVGCGPQAAEPAAGVFTGIFWYASYPNHYQGDSAGANAARGAAA